MSVHTRVCTRAYVRVYVCVSVCVRKARSVFLDLGKTHPGARIPRPPPCWIWGWLRWPPARPQLGTGPAPTPRPPAACPALLCASQTSLGAGRGDRALGWVLGVCPGERGSGGFVSPQVTSLSADQRRTQQSMASPCVWPQRGHWRCCRASAFCENRHGLALSLALGASTVRLRDVVSGSPAWGPSVSAPWQTGGALRIQGPRAWAGHHSSGTGGPFPVCP